MDWSSSRLNALLFRAQSHSCLKLRRIRQGRWASFKPICKCSARFSNYSRKLSKTRNLQITKAKVSPLLRLGTFIPKNINYSKQTSNSGYRNWLMKVSSEQLVWVTQCCYKSNRTWKAVSSNLSMYWTNSSHPTPMNCSLNCLNAPRKNLIKSLAIHRYKYYRNCQVLHWNTQKVTTNLIANNAKTMWLSCHAVRPNCSTPSLALNIQTMAWVRVRKLLFNLSRLRSDLIIEFFNG
jgi:hypothetical protein